MTDKELSKLVSAHFTAMEINRLKWCCMEMGHSWIELCKVPFLRFGEEVADIGKYVLGIGVPVMILFFATA